MRREGIILRLRGRPLESYYESTLVKELMLFWKILINQLKEY